MSTTHGTRSVVADANPVALSPMHAAYVRRALFDDLASLAEALAEQAAAAAQPDPGISGVDAESTCRVLIAQVAEVLDAVGWNVADDGELLVALERAQRPEGS